MSRTPAHLITDEHFYKIGFTPIARKYPLSDKAVEWLARFNGIPIEKMPDGWFYAPNVFMQKELEEYALGIRVIKSVNTQ